MRFVVLTGPPAVGKLTVARELHQLSGWRLFHNHLVVDALLAVFEFGSRDFIEMRQSIWLEVFARASHAGVNGLIFTFNPENSVAQEFIDRLVSDAKARGDSLTFVALTCREDEIERRIGSASRVGKKLTSLEIYRQLRDSGTFDRPLMPKANFSAATDTATPAENAHAIWEFLSSV